MKKTSVVKTKSILKKIAKSDGIRVCIMRRVKPEYAFDLWLPHLAPSEKLLTKYVIEKKIKWDDFKPLFLKELKKQTKWLNLVKQMSESENVTLLCAESSPVECHRSLVLAELKERFPECQIKLG